MNPLVIRLAASLAIGIVPFLTLSALAEPPGPVLTPDRAGGPPDGMMSRYLGRLAHEALARRREDLERLKTPGELAEWQQERRELFIAQLGGFPERTPLNPQLVGTLDGDGYRIKKLIYESRPRHFVTAALYLPLGTPPFPGVLVPCGHSANGKAAETYQRVCILLAKNGLAALCYDPIGQGERSQLLTSDGRPRFGSTLEHTLAGAGAIVVGRNTASYRVWDGIRSLDYLASRDDIDATQLGCTGNSGGGTLTSYLMALDERIACAVPSCYLTSFDRLIDTIGPQDAEQNIHAQIALGIDHSDYVLMRAPRPTLICAATRDFFDIGGTWDTFREAKRFYTRLGAAERVDLIETDAEHGFSRELRIGAVRFIRQWLLDADDSIDEPDIAIHADSELQCTPDGQVMLIEGARSVFDLNRMAAEEFAAERNLPRRREEGGGRRKLVEDVRRLAGIRPLDAIPLGRIETVASEPRTGYTIESLILEPEPGIVLPAMGYLPDEPIGESILYLDDRGMSAAADPDGPIEAFVQQGRLVLAVDLRGIGESAPQADDPEWERTVGGDWKDFFLAYLLGKSYVGMRAEDILFAARFLRTYHADGPPREIEVHARGRLAPPLLHAAALEPDLAIAWRLVEGPPDSWMAMVEDSATDCPLVNLVHGALSAYDLPDLEFAVESAPQDP